MNDLESMEVEQMAQALVEFAFSDRSAPPCARRKARSFIESNMSWIEGFRRADMPYGDIASIVTRLGYPVSGPQLARVASACSDRADAAVVRRFERLVRLRRLRGLTSSLSGQVAAATPPASRVAAPIPSPSAKPPVAAAKPRSTGQLDLVSIDGEDSDIDSNLTTNPQSFGDMRRRLFDAVGREQKTYFHFADGERIDVPAQLHRDIFLARIRSWSELSKRLASM